MYRLKDLILRKSHCQKFKIHREIIDKTIQVDLYSKQIELYLDKKVERFWIDKQINLNFSRKIDRQIFLKKLSESHYQKFNTQRERQIKKRYLVERYIKILIDNQINLNLSIDIYS